MQSINVKIFIYMVEEMKRVKVWAEGKFYDIFFLWKFRNVYWFSSKFPPTTLRHSTDNHFYCGKVFSTLSNFEHVPNITHLRNKFFILFEFLFIFCNDYRKRYIQPSSILLLSHHNLINDNIQRHSSRTATNSKRISHSLNTNNFTRARWYSHQFHIILVTR